MAGEENKWQEIKAIIISALVLGFVFGFDDKREVFNGALWTQNFIQQALIALIALIIFVKATKMYSSRKGVKTTFSVWSMYRFGFRKGAKLKKGAPIGIIISIFIAIMSYGTIFFSAILSPRFAHTAKSRLGNKFEAPMESEISLISLVGPLLLSILGIFLAAISKGEINNLSLISFSIAFCSMLPFPGLNGIKVYFGSPAKYVFAMVFITLSYYLSKIASPFQALIWGIISAGIIAIAYYIHSFIIARMKK